MGAIVKVFQNGQFTNNYSKYVADTEDDVKKIPILPNGGSMGNEAYIIESNKTYILDSQGIWHSKAIGDDSIIECDCVEESTVWEELPKPTE